nr:hypothetical protein Itr_chr06CG14730 [Ipomoea trifida]
MSHLCSAGKRTPTSSILALGGTSEKKGETSPWSPATTSSLIPLEKRERNSEALRWPILLALPVVVGKIGEEKAVDSATKD